MKLLLTVLTGILLFSGNLFASGNENDHKGMKHDKNHSHKDTTMKAKRIAKDKVLIKVKGMVCSFCAQGVTKNFNKKSEVKSTKVDLDKMEVLVTFKKGKTLSDATIKQVVTDAGFSYVEHK